MDSGLAGRYLECRTLVRPHDELRGSVSVIVLDTPVAICAMGVLCRIFVEIIAAPVLSVCAVEVFVLVL